MSLIPLDTRVALAAQAPQIDFNQLTRNTLDLYDNVKQRGQQGTLSRLLAQNTGLDGQMDLSGALLSAQTDPKQAYQANTVTTLAGLIQQQNAAKYKAQQDAIKFKADTAKTDAETGKLSQEGVGKGLENTQKGQTALANLIATSIDPLDASNKLKMFGQQYGLPKEVQDGLQSQIGAIATMEDGGKSAFEQIKQSYGLLGAEKPIEYMEADANNKLTNKTSASNNAATVGASKYVADVGAATAAAKLKQDGEHFDKPKFEESVTAPNGQVYGIFSDGSVDLLPDGAGGTLTEQPTKKEKLNSSALKQVNEYNGQLVFAKANQVKVGHILKDLQSGRLNLSPQAILAAEGRSRVGQSTANDLAIGRFNTALNQAVNDVLMLAKGTQTEGDANRAAQTIRANPPRDNAAALQVLQNLAFITKTNITALDNNLNTTYANFGLERPQLQQQRVNPVNNSKAASSSDGLDGILFNQ